MASKFNGKKGLLGDQQYRTVYGKLDTICEKTTDQLIFKIQRQCDLINMIDLVIPSKYPINSLIRKIEVCVDQYTVDMLSASEDIETQLKTNALIFKREISTVGHQTFIPLCMAPFHSNNLVFPSTTYQELSIVIHLQPKDKDKDKDTENIEFYCNKYVVGKKNDLFDNYHDFITVQSQYTGAQRLQKGLNKINLELNHAVYLIYLWGFDKSKVNNVRLLLNGNVFLDASAAALEHQKTVRGYGKVEPLILFISEDDPGEQSRCAINFTLIESCILEIDTEEESAPLYCVGLNLQPLCYGKGQMGLRYQ